MPTLSGAPSWAIERATLAGTTNWELFTLPGWVRTVRIKNEHASGVLFVGNYDESGAYSSGTDKTHSLAAGETLDLTLAPGRQASDAAHLVVPLYSATASMVVSFVMQG